jgi:hypothetical protein
MKFNWKTLLFTVASPFVSSLGIVLSNNLAGTHVPFTAATVLLPAIPIAVKSLTALYTTSPSKE